MPCEACLLMPVKSLYASTQHEHMKVSFENVKLHTFYMISNEFCILASAAQRYSTALSIVGHY